MNFQLDEVLLEIFDRLDDDSLVATSKVCQRWFQLITSSASLMKRFTLSIVIQYNHNFEVYGKFVTGNYKNIYIQSYGGRSYLPSEFYECIAEHKMTVRSITLRDFLFTHLISTINVFDLKNITNLSLIECDYNTNEAIAIEMPNLSHLELIHSTEFLKFIKIHRVKVLKISNCNYFGRKVKPIIKKLLNSFLETCDSLKELTISKFNNNFTPLVFKIDEFKFNLVSLTVEGTIIDNLKAFLLSQKNSLRILAIHSENKNAELLKVIFNNLSLKELEINVENIRERFPSIIKNLTIKKLILRRIPIFTMFIDSYDEVRAARLAQNQNPAFDNHDEEEIAQQPISPLLILEVHRENPLESAENIISICSVVEEISIYDFNLTKYDNFLASINTLLPNLKVLQLSTLSSSIEHIVKFNNLTHIYVDNVTNEIQIKSLIFLVNLCPNLKVIKINKITADVLNVNDFTTIINEAKKLEEFYIGSDFIFTTEMYEAAKNVKELNHPLRRLIFTKSSHDKQGLYDSTNIKMKYFKFSQCDESQLFFPSMADEFKLDGMQRDVSKRSQMLNESKQNILHEHSDLDLSMLFEN